MWADSDRKAWEGAEYAQFPSLFFCPSFFFRNSFSGSLPRSALRFALDFAQQALAMMRLHVAHPLPLLVGICSGCAVRACCMRKAGARSGRFAAELPG